MKLKRRIPFLVLAALLLFAVSGCGRTAQAQTDLGPSELYTARELRLAARAAAWWFRFLFDGCTLTSLRYPGDEWENRYLAASERYGAERAVVLLSDFRVGPDGGDGSLPPDGMIWDWQWILVQDSLGFWHHVDHGFG